MIVILVGGGQAMYFLAQTFLSKEHQVTIVNRDAAECTRLARTLEATIIHGDGSDLRILEDAGARAADVVLAATPSDADNLIICQLAQSHFGVPRAEALVNDPENQSVFQALGIGAISTSLTVASLIEQRASLDQVTDVFAAGEGKVMISEIVVLDESPLDGVRLPQPELLPQRALIAAVIRDGEATIAPGSMEIRAGDRVLLVTLAEAREEALRLLSRAPDRD